MGRRTVAGQVVKESYGTAKQQHTFTVSLTSNVVDHHYILSSCCLLSSNFQSDKLTIWFCVFTKD